MFAQGENEVPPFTFANRFGIIRKEVVASTVDALQVDCGDGQHDGSRVTTVCLRFPSNVEKPGDRGVAQTLIDPNSQAHVLIPQGSRITECIVSANGQVDKNLKLVLGRFCSDVKNIDCKRALAESFVPFKTPISGQILNTHKTISFSGRLNKDNVEVLNRIYNDDAKSQGEQEFNAPSYECLNGCANVGEPKQVYIAGTVMEGNLDCQSLSVLVSYITPSC